MKRPKTIRINEPKAVEHERQPQEVIDARIEDLKLHGYVLNEQRGMYCIDEIGVPMQTIETTPQDKWPHMEAGFRKRAIERNLENQQRAITAMRIEELLQMGGTPTSNGYQVVKPSGKILEVFREDIHNATTEEWIHLKKALSSQEEVPMPKVTGNADNHPDPEPAATKEEPKDKYIPVASPANPMPKGDTGRSDKEIAQQQIAVMRRLMNAEYKTEYGAALGNAVNTLLGKVIAYIESHIEKLP